MNTISQTWTKRIWTISWWITLIAAGWLLAMCSGESRKEDITKSVDSTGRSADTTTMSSETSHKTETNADSLATTKTSASIILWAGANAKTYFDEQIKNEKKHGITSSGYQYYTKDQVINRTVNYVERVYNVGGDNVIKPKKNEESVILFIPREAIDRLLADVPTGSFEDGVSKGGFLAFLAIDQDSKPGKPLEDPEDPKDRKFKNQTVILAPYKTNKDTGARKYKYEIVATTSAYGVERWERATKLQTLFGSTTDYKKIKDKIKDEYLNRQYIEEIPY